MSDEIKPASPLPWTVCRKVPGYRDESYIVHDKHDCKVLMHLRLTAAWPVDLDYIVDACNEYPALRARAKELEEALGDVIAVCEHANKDAFANGVTDSTGGMDEGEVRSWEAIERARKALGLNTKGRGSDD